MKRAPSFRRESSEGDSNEEDSSEEAWCFICRGWDDGEADRTCHPCVTCHRLVCTHCQQGATVIGKEAPLPVIPGTDHNDAVLRCIVCQLRALAAHHEKPREKVQCSACLRMRSKERSTSCDYACDNNYTCDRCIASIHRMWKKCNLNDGDYEECDRLFDYAACLPCRAHGIRDAYEYKAKFGSFIWDRSKVINTPRL